ncbi:MAG: alpha-2-macroglobulin, partial [Planctomycetaceae bacterium]|nr:alpha-2-macroglobulin [Planctomycetaceae bacterium]
DGGWGWFGGCHHGSAHLTALVIHGLQIAGQSGVVLPEDVVRRGRECLKRYQQEQIVLLKNASLSDEEKKHKHWKDRADEEDAFVFMVLAEQKAETLDGNTADMLEFLQRDRGKLSPYGAAMLGIAESMLPGKHDLTPYVKILEQYLVQDEENQTAYLNLNRGGNWCWWAWYGSEFETQAYYLKLLMRADPKSPVAPRLVKYLLANRKHASYWNSTRDTAICIEAFAEFLKTTGEDKPNVTVEILIDGKIAKTVSFTPDNFLTVDNTLTLTAADVAAGGHKIEVRKREPAACPVYITAFLENFTLEDPIAKAGLEVKIERRLYKLVRDASAAAQTAGSRGQVVDMKVEKFKREPLGQNAFLQSGDLVEVELVLDSKNDYESLLIEDWKGAGLEAADVRSGYNGNDLGAYVEFRDERVVFFVHQLTRGKHSVSYRLRAEQPGEFSALPARIEAMYAPELKGNADENKVKVKTLRHKEKRGDAGTLREFL